MTALLLLCGLAAAAGGGETARAEPSQAAVRLGEPFEYAVAWLHARDEVVELAPLPPLEPFAAGGSGCRTTAGERGALTVCALRLQLLDLGEHEVPALALRVRGPEGERLVPAPGARVRGLSVTDPRTPAAALPLRFPPPAPVRVPRWGLLQGIGGGLAAALAALLLWLRWRRRPAAPAAPLRLSPHERLEKRLGEILWLDLPRRGRGREHQARLADAVREFLAATAPGVALDLTSGELLAALAARPAPGLEPPALARFLSSADLVKFARHEPSGEECDAASAFALALAARTRPAPERITVMTAGGKEAGRA